MYEEILRTLRACPDAEYGCSRCKYQNSLGCREKLMSKAADVIKELQDRIATSEAIIERQSDIIQAKDRDLQRAIDAKPQWISVTERLPAAERKSYWVCTNTGYQCECRWTNNQFGIGESDEWGWSIFDIPQYQNIVAWMSLPDPYKPREET